MAVQLNPEHQKVADETVSAWIEKYTARTGAQPSNRAVSYVRNAVQRSMLPTSEIIKKLVEIGHKGMAARKPDHYEFDALAEELDRRLPVGDLDMNLIDEEVKKI